MFPENIDIIYTEWLKVADAILKEVSERKVSLTYESDYGEYYFRRIFEKWITLMKNNQDLVEMCRHQYFCNKKIVSSSVHKISMKKTIGG